MNLYRIRAKFIVDFDIEAESEDSAHEKFWDSDPEPEDGVLVDVTNATTVHTFTYGSSKLSESNVLDIRSRIKSGESQCSLARNFDVSQACINRIALCQTWKHLLPPIEHVESGER